LPVVLDIGLLIVATTAIHGLVTALFLVVANRLRPRLARGKALALRFSFVPLLVLALLLVGLLEASLWAWYYVAKGHLQSFTDGLYFSLITMTTLGYGDITLVGAGRLVSGMQAALGIVLFGWTSALIFAAVEGVHERR